MEAPRESATQDTRPVPARINLEHHNSRHIGMSRTEAAHRWESSDLTAGSGRGDLVFALQIYDVGRANMFTLFVALCTRIKEKAGEAIDSRIDGVDQMTCAGLFKKHARSSSTEPGNWKRRFL